MSGPSSSSSQSRQQQVFAPTQDYAQMGMAAGLSFVCGSVVVGAVAFSMGNKPLYDRLFRVRMVAVATTMGFYAAASGWLKPPPLLSTIVGREPRALPDAPPLFPRTPKPPSS